MNALELALLRLTLLNLKYF